MENEQCVFDVFGKINYLQSFDLVSDYCCYHTLDSLSVFLLAKNLQLILEISATYRVVSYLLADNWLICRLCAQCMISMSNVKLCPCILSMRRCVCRYSFRNNVYCDKKLIRFGLCNIRNNQGLGKCYQPRPSARLIKLTSTLIILDITKPYPIIQVCCPL